MFHIALCDDNQEDLRILIRYLSELKQADCQIECMPFTNGMELVNSYKNKQRFHLIILDMIMHPINGIETAKQIRMFDTDVPILIVTATVEFAMDGYQVNAYRYILKPVSKNYFLKEVQELLVRSSKELNQYFSFNSESGLSKLRLSSIFYFESNIRTIKILANAQTHYFTAKISDIENYLCGNDFVRIHKSYIVNLKYVRNIFKDAVTMDNGEELPLSKHKSKYVRERFLNYMRNNV